MKRNLIFLLFLSLVCVRLCAGHTSESTHTSSSTSSSNQLMNFDVTSGEQLVVDTSGDIEVTVSNQDQVVVTSTDLDESSRLIANHTGKIVRVNSRGEYADLHITVPSKFDTDLVTNSGDIRITGTLSGKINASTAGGDITLDDAAGEIDLRTSGGVITVKNVEGNAVLHSSGGEIYAGKITGSLDIQTGGGDLSLNNVGKSLIARSGGGNIETGDIGGTATVSTGGGDISIGGVHGELKASSGGGNIEAGKVDGNVTLKTGGGDVDLQSATGAVIAKSSGGNITMQNISGSLDASTSGGDVFARLKPNGAGSDISSAGGDITLYVPETAKVKIDAIIRIRGRWQLRTQESDIVSDFKAASYDRNEDEQEIHAVYILNGGGELISLETVNSNISIKALK